MTSVLKDIKIRLEMSNISLIDTKLLHLANSHITYLINNGIPLNTIEKATTIEEFSSSVVGSYPVVIDYITTMIIIDLNIEALSATSYNILDRKANQQLYHLKVLFDREND